MLTEEAKECILLTDGELPSDCLNMEFAELLRQSGPFGQHFPEPIFEHTFELLQQRVVGDKHYKCCAIAAAECLMLSLLMLMYALGLIPGAPCTPSLPARH